MIFLKVPVGMRKTATLTMEKTVRGGTIPLRPRTLLIRGILRKNKMATTAVRRLTLYPMQDIACEHGSLKYTCLIDFTF